MYKNIVIALCVNLLFVEAKSQSSNITSVMLEVEQNNKELQAYSSLVESKKRELKSSNNLPDPQAGAYYLPLGDHNNGAYSEFQVTQSFEFPTVYGKRNNLINKIHEQLELDYAVKRQEVLLAAKEYCLELVYLNKILEVERLRVQRANKVLNQVEQLYEKEQVGILELNKAKIAWMQEQFVIEKIETDAESILILLKNLNGGKELFFNQSELIENLQIAELDSLWHEKLLLDPSFIQLSKENDVALQQIKLSRNYSFPNLTVGYNYQGVSGSTYSGVYGGISIPLWNNKNKVKSAKANYQYKQDIVNSQTLSAYAIFQKQYNTYSVLLKKFNEYESTLSGLDNDALLQQSYELGELSFMEYYLEMLFYHKAYDAMIEMENQLNKLKAELLKHQL